MSVNKQLKELAPMLFATQPHYGTSEKYHFIKTKDK
jgi:hypothetical protein